MQRLIALIIIVALGSGHVYVLRKATLEQKTLSQGEVLSYVLPSPVLKISALEFDGIASDFMFLRSLVFLGSLTEKRILSKSSAPVATDQDWRWFHAMLCATTDLDPHFLDPYFIGQAYLTWDARMIAETNALLEKGSDHRTWDWMLPFFIGFNSFYFLQDNQKASRYLMEASRRPNASTLLASLATRLAVKAQKTENAIIFLEEMLKKTDDKATQKEFELRLKTLRIILALEKASSLYEKRYGKKPEKLELLHEKGFIRFLPDDPYGGKFYIDNEGVIKTTSNLNPMRSQ